MSKSSVSKSKHSGKAGGQPPKASLRHNAHMSGITPPSDSNPNTIEALVPVIAGTTGGSSAERVAAISALGNLLQKDKPSDHKTTDTEGSGDKRHARGIFCLLSLIEKDTDVTLILHAIGVLSRIKAYSGVSVIIDVALAIRIALYENKDSASFIESDDSLRLRSAAAQALGKLGDERAIVPLMSILNDKKENYRLRLACAEALGKLGNIQAVTPLVDILNDEREKSLYLKESAAKALGMLGDIRALEPLLDVLESKRGIRDKFNFLKEQVVEAIGRIGGRSSKATSSLLRVLKDESPSIRLAAVEALSNLGDPSVLDSLQELIFDHDDDVALATVSAVYHLGGEPAVRELLEKDNLPQFVRDELESYIP
jgi:HEAT repeat protein